MNKNIAIVLIGVTIGLWLVFLIKHIELVIITVLCIIALRYLFSEFSK